MTAWQLRLAAFGLACTVSTGAWAGFRQPAQDDGRSASLPTWGAASPIATTPPASVPSPAPSSVSPGPIAKASPAAADDAALAAESGHFVTDVGEKPNPRLPKDLDV